MRENLECEASVQGQVEGKRSGSSGESSKENPKNDTDNAYNDYLQEHANAHNSYMSPNQLIETTVQGVERDISSKKCKVRLSLTKSVSRTSLGEEITKYSTINPTDKIHRKNKALFVRKSSVTKTKNQKSKNGHRQYSDQGKQKNLTTIGKNSGSGLNQDKSMNNLNFDKYWQG